MNCTICGSDIRFDGDPHECGRDEISPAKGRPAGVLRGPADNVGTWERIHEAEEPQNTRI